MNDKTQGEHNRSAFGCITTNPLLWSASDGFERAVQRFVIKAPTLAETKEGRRRRALESIAAQNWQLPPDYKFDREEANDRSRDTH